MRERKFEDHWVEIKKTGSREPVFFGMGRRAFSLKTRIAVGWMRLTVAVVEYVERSVDIFRIISARKATEHEAKRYALRNGN
jgi:uncharacterized DUF497 family protein